MTGAGQLKHRVTIKGVIETKTAQFGFTKADLIVAKRTPSFVEPLSGRELERAQQIEPRSTHRVTMRYRTGVKAGQTLIYHDGRAGDRPFEIVAPPLDIEMNHVELQILCREQVAA